MYEKRDDCHSAFDGNRYKRCGLAIASRIAVARSRTCCGGQSIEVEVVKFDLVLQLRFFPSRRSITLTRAETFPAAGCCIRN